MSTAAPVSQKNHVALWLLTVLVSMGLGGAVVYAVTMGLASSRLKVARESTQSAETKAVANGKRLDELHDTLVNQPQVIESLLDVKLSSLGFQKVGTK